MKESLYDRKVTTSDFKCKWTQKRVKRKSGKNQTFLLLTCYFAIYLVIYICPMTCHIAKDCGNTLLTRRSKRKNGKERRRECKDANTFTGAKRAL